MIDKAASDNQPRYLAKKFRWTNSRTWKREVFAPQNPPKVLFYSCGPTVYGLLHIGNARALITADLFYRWLMYIGYDVNFVRNYTDVDDKIIKRALDEGVSSEEVAKKYIDICENEIQQLGLKKPTKVVTVTETMPEIIQLIKEIIANDHAYVVDGEVLFSIDSFKAYGKLSQKNTEELLAGARVEVNRSKKNPLDFSLWKPAKAGEPSWDSPWGRGRPGWHIECSAMANLWLGKTIDVHHGGQDLIFPHHENETAQSEAASGQEFCRHWVHNAMLTMSSTKMSKSLGNILTIEDFLKTYGPELLKYIYISHHFRSSVDFSDALLHKSADELDRVYLAKKWACDVLDSKADEGNDDDLWKNNKGKAEIVFDKIEDELFSDFNTPGALGHLFSYIRELNRLESQSKAISESKKIVAQEFLELIDKKLFLLFGTFGLNVSEAFDSIAKIKKAMLNDEALLSEEQIQQLLNDRTQARKDKNFKRSDEIRDQLQEKGILIIDGPQGTTWKYR